MVEMVKTMCACIWQKKFDKNVSSFTGDHAVLAAVIGVALVGAALLFIGGFLFVKKDGRFWKCASPPNSPGIIWGCWQGCFFLCLCAKWFDITQFFNSGFLLFWFFAKQVVLSSLKTLSLMHFEHKISWFCYIWKLKWNPGALKPTLWLLLAFIFSFVYPTHSLFHIKVLLVHCGQKW